MADQDVQQIRIGRHRIGIMGLHQVFEEMAAQAQELDEGTLTEELYRRLAATNYIPGSAREDYARAFLREFKKFLGKPVEEPVTAEREIQVIGPGCAQCDELERLVMEVLSELGRPANVEHVRDPRAIGEMGILGTPALVIDGKVVCVGRVPPRSKLIEWLSA